MSKIILVGLIKAAEVEVDVSEARRFLANANYDDLDSFADHEVAEMYVGFKEYGGMLHPQWDVSVHALQRV